MTTTPEHITVTADGPDRYDLSCTVCGMSVQCGTYFGSIPGANFAAAFVTEHTTHSPKRKPTGRVRR